MTASPAYKPAACKGNCGKDIVFERQPDGKWLVSEFDVENWVKLEKHLCPNYKPQPKPFEQRGQGTNWAGTNKQGQMFEARESPKETIKQEIHRIDEIIKKLDELIGLSRETLITVKTKPDAHQEPQQKEETERKEDEYGF